MTDKPTSKTIFIGNIPYGLSEEQIISLFSSAGQVLSFRLVTDPDTGKPKGYGFAEFADADAAASAVRNLNDHSIMGRQLRVDFSHKDGGGQSQQPGHGAGGFGGGGAGSTNMANIMSMGGMPGAGGILGGVGGVGAPGAAPPPPVNIAAVPQGVALPPGVSCPDAISQTLMQIGPAQLLDILSQFKKLVTDSPTAATELLRQQPQLSYAVFQCLLTMGLVDANVLKTVIDGGSAQAAMAGQQRPGVVPTPPVQQHFQPPGPPPIMQQQQQPGPPPHLPPGMSPEQLAAIKSILMMPPEQYNSLGPAEKAQVDMLKSQYGAFVR